MALNRQKIQDLYRKRTGRYDLTANLYYLIGLREWHYRQREVDALQLKEGDFVVELGCGTGLNFPLLQRVIGLEGRIIGVDLTDRMLEQANKWVFASKYGSEMPTESNKRAAPPMTSWPCFASLSTKKRSEGLPGRTTVRYPLHRLLRCCRYRQPGTGSERRYKAQTRA